MLTKLEKLKLKLEIKKKIKDHIDKGKFNIIENKKGFFLEYKKSFTNFDDVDEDILNESLEL